MSRLRQRLPELGRAVAQSRWRRRDRRPDGPLSPLMGAGVAALDDDRVVVFGGNSWSCPPTADCGGSGDPYFTDGGVFDSRDDTWHPFPPGPDGDWGGDMAGMLDDDRLTMEYDHGWLLDVASADWIEVPGRPSDALAYDFSHTTVGRSLFTFGGQRWPDDGTGDGELLSDAWQWSPPT